MGSASLGHRHSAIVVGLPWLKSGTTRVMEMQISHLKSLGFKTTFVAVPNGYDSGSDIAAWNKFIDNSSELGADHVVVAPFQELTFFGKLQGAAVALAKGYNAMHWAVAPAHLTKVPEELVSILVTEDVSVLLVNHVYTMPFATKLRAILASRGKTIPILVVTHDVQTHILRDKNSVAPWSFKIESEDRLVKTEIEWLAQADQLIHVSDSDFAFFKLRLPTHQHHLLLPAVPQMELASFREMELPRRDLLYVGTDHPGNIKSMKWYFNEVVPMFRESAPRLTLVGSVCDARLSFEPAGTPTPWLEIAGQVDDLRPYYASSKIALGPTIQGRGVSIKTIEAFAAGLPVAGTDLAFRGIPQSELSTFNIKGENEPRRFADLISSLMADETRGTAAKVSREIYQRLFTPDKSLAQFTQILSTVIQA